MGIIPNTKSRSGSGALSEEQWNTLQRKLDKISKETLTNETILKDLKETAKTVSWLKKEVTVLQQRTERLEHLLEMNSCGVTETKRTPQIIVTLTSYDKRICTVPLVLERLMNQTLKPDRIVLYLSVKNFPEKEAELPLRLLEMRKQGLEIRWLEEDLKSYKKLLPALKDFPNDLLITVDDDLYMDLNMVERLYENHRRHPEAVIASRGHIMTFDKGGKLLPYDEWGKSCSSPDMIPRFDVLPTTGAGTLFPPSCFTEEVFNDKVIRECCPHADDLWVKIMLTLKRVPVLLPDKRYPLQLIEGTQDDKLWDINIEANDVQIRRLLDLYKKEGSDYSFFHEG